MEMCRQIELKRPTINIITIFDKSLGTLTRVVIFGGINLGFFIVGSFFCVYWLALALLVQSGVHNRDRLLGIKPNKHKEEEEEKLEFD